jgi:hypothetical protein
MENHCVTIQHRATVTNQHRALAGRRRAIFFRVNGDFFVNRSCARAPFLQ